MDDILYRYISFEDFVNLVVNNKERYVRPASWDDKFEGYLFKYLENKQDIRQVVSKIYKDLCPNDYDAICAIPVNYIKMWYSKWFTYAQCWTSLKEKDAMWRCYAYGNKAIRIRTREDKLLAHTNHVFSANKVDVCLRQVSYDLDKEIAVEQQIHQIKNSLLIYEPFFHKRDVFDHEKEFRLLVTDLSWTHAEKLSKYAMTYQIHELIEETSDEERIDYLSEQIYKNRIDWEKQEVQIPDVRIEDAGNVSGFLEGVMVHPLAESWYVEIVRNICQSRNITFEGQSKLYELE